MTFEFAKDATSPLTLRSLHHTSVMSADSPIAASVLDESQSRSSNEGILAQPSVVLDSEAVWNHRETYGPSGLRGVLMNHYAASCAAFAALGGMLFGYDQGVVSIVLVMPSFLARFNEVDGSTGGFWKGLLTAMIELGALFGALNQGWLADKISRKYSIVVAVW